MSILVTGANGFVGMALCSTLREHNQHIVRCVRSESDFVDECPVGDIDANTDWEHWLAGVTVVVHTAARVHVMHEVAKDSLAEYRRVNVDGTLKLARQAADAGVNRFIFISSAKVNGESTPCGKPFSERDVPYPVDFYGRSKFEAEEGLRALSAISPMEVVIIRPPLVYGPGVKANFAALMRAVARGVPMPLASIDNLRSYVGVDNLVDFIMTCVGHPAAANETFLVSDGSDVSTPALIRAMAVASAVPCRTFAFPVALLRGVSHLLGKENVVSRLCDSLQVDISKARSILGWTPPISLQEGLRRAISHNVPR